MTRKPVEQLSADDLGEGRVLFHGSDSAAETRRALKRLGLAPREVFPIELATRAVSAATGAHVFGRWE